MVPILRAYHVDSTTMQKLIQSSKVYQMQLKHVVDLLPSYESVGTPFLPSFLFEQYKFFKNGGRFFFLLVEFKRMFHSQDGQDEFLETHIFRKFENGVFVDVGAHDGVSINNTLFFEENRGWSGLNIEPIPSVYERLVANRPKCVNINCAVSNDDGEAEFILNQGYTEMISGLQSTFDPRHLDRLKRENRDMGSSSTLVNVKTQKLASILAENNIQHVHYLSIDVEGAEFEVVKSIDFDKVYIDVIGFENNYADVSGPIIDCLKTKGYLVVHRCLDIIMIHEESRFRRCRTLAYINWWPDDSPQEEWYFSKYIRKYVTPIRIIEPRESPDILLCSVFGPIDEVLKCTAGIKVFFTGENLVRFPAYSDLALLQANFDLIVGFCPTDVARKMVRFPLWLCYYGLEPKAIIDRIEEGYKANVHNKTVFASLVARHDEGGQRTRMYNELRQYGEIACPGQLLRNVDVGEFNKVEFISSSKFNICPENSYSDGYCTEKLFEALEAGCIPIYLGHMESEVLNESKICNCNDGELAYVIRDAVANSQKFVHGPVFKPNAAQVIERYLINLGTQLTQCVSRLPNETK